MIPDPLTAKLAEATSEVARADTKASMLLALAGAGAAATVNELVPGTGLPLATRALGWLAVALLAVAVLLLLCAVRPRLRLPGGPVGIVAWASSTPEQLARPDVDPLSARLAAVSALAVRKYSQVRTAFTLSAAAVAVLVAAGLTAGAAALV